MNPKVLVNTGQSTTSHPDLSQPAILTADFFTPRVVYTHEFVPGERWNCVVNGMTRCNPLSKPAYADIKNNVRAYFVPLRTLWYRWNAFIENSPDGMASVQSVFTIKPSTIIEALTSFSIDGLVIHTTFFEPDNTDFKNSPEPLLDPCDLAYKLKDETPGATYPYLIKTIRLGRLARQWYNILLGLGYNINTYNRDWAVNDISDDNPLRKSISAMPILAYAKLYADYYISPRDPYAYNQVYKQLNEFYTGQVSEITTQRLIAMFAACSDINYKQDLFTTAWENPSGPDSGSVVGGFGLADPALTQNNQQSPRVDASINSTNSGLAPRIRFDPGNPTETYLTQYLDTALHKVADMYQRYKLCGIRPADRYLSERGLKLKSEYNNRSIYIGHGESTFKITDTTSLGDIENLGEFKGQASDYNLNIRFDFDSEEFGYIICISTVVPDIKYYNGMPRYLQHLTRNSFYNPTFDKLGVQAIRADELKSGITQVYGSYYQDEPVDPYNDFDDDEIIGYHDRYYEYKQNCQGLLLGDFAMHSRNAGMDVWHLWRDVEKRVLLDADFRAAYDRPQYDRIFAVQDSENDGFIQLFHFSVKPSLPMSSSFDSYEWSDPDAKKASVKVNGEYNV